MVAVGIVGVNFAADNGGVCDSRRYYKAHQKVAERLSSFNCDDVCLTFGLSLCFYVSSHMGYTMISRDRPNAAILRIVVCST